MTDWLAASPAPDLSQYLTASHGAYSATDHALNGSLPWQLGDGAELDFSLSPTKPANTSLYGSEQDSFCSRNTVDDCVAYLNQVRLTDLGGYYWNLFSGALNLDKTTATHLKFWCL